ncbi:MAG: VWA domain-containing protein [Candidatus Omnitrophica bacterium]|nr:VWA domain-containing protein [Candidatus Omnitrophota bacterium]
MFFAGGWNIIWLFIFVPLVVFVYFRTRARGDVAFSSVKDLKEVKTSFLVRARHIPIFLRVLALSLLIFGLMRPEKGIEESKIRTEGVDIMLVLDISGSMMAEDFVLNGQRTSRLEVIKNVVKDFIKKRSNDRIGLVIFSGRAYLQCPLTTDYGVLLKFVDRLSIGMIEDGTAIGDGLATALARLKDIQSKSKIVILLTDGVNNRGKVDPMNAAALSAAIHVKVYTIGAGSKGQVPFPVQDFFGNKVYQWAVIDVDEDLLKKMAEATGGKYYRAVDFDSLKKIYNEIDRLEKTKIETKSYSEYHELFVPFALAALILLLIEEVLRYTRFRTLP